MREQKGPSSAVKEEEKRTAFYSLEPLFKGIRGLHRRRTFYVNNLVEQISNYSIHPFRLDNFRCFIDPLLDLQLIYFQGTEN